MNFKDKPETRAGSLGEKYVHELLLSGRECWRYDISSVGKGIVKMNRCYKGSRCVHAFKAPSAEDAIMDDDFIVTLNCEGCPYLRDGDDVYITQRHEVKTNVSTHDVSIGGKSSRTQNLYIEWIQNLRACTSQQKLDTWTRKLDTKVECQKTPSLTEP